MLYIKTPQLGEHSCLWSGTVSFNSPARGLLENIWLTSGENNISPTKYLGMCENKVKQETNGLHCHE